jgi:transcriptional regulator with XRE-family HTH domain
MKGSDAKADTGSGFAQRLRELRRQRNLSQSELGELASIHYTHVSRYERGVSKPSAETLKRIADALAVTGDFLMEGAADEAAKARFEDRELLQQFQEVQKLPDEEKLLVKRFLDAFLFQRRVHEMAAR